jgi:hypothetical protein
MLTNLVNSPRTSRTVLAITAGMFCAVSCWAQAAVNACDLNADGTVNVIDVQLAVNMDLGTLPCKADVDGAGICNSDVVNKVVIAALGGTCVVTSHHVVLNWTASTSSNISGYNLYRSTSSAGSYTKVNTAVVVPTSYTDNTVLAGMTYYYVATTVDASGNESAYSNQAQAAVPTP